MEEPGTASNRLAIFGHHGQVGADKRSGCQRNQQHRGAHVVDRDQSAHDGNRHRPGSGSHGPLPRDRRDVAGSEEVGAGGEHEHDHKPHIRSM